MRVAVVSDIHANRHALEAVLEQIGQSGCKTIWSLGDVVGYGAEPELCVQSASGSFALNLAGNHDLAVLGKLDLNEFSLGARRAAEWTRGVISHESRDWLNGLAPSLVLRDVGLYHASPRDPVWEYVLSPLLAELCLDEQPRAVSLIGHSHVALSFARSGHGPAVGEQRRDGDRVAIGSGEWLLNPGSVGQPRDGDPRAAWLELDLIENIATFHRAAYDIHGAAAAIRAAGLPGSLADRLRFGQ